MKRRVGGIEYISIMAFIMSNVAFSIDALLPAFPKIRDDFDLSTSENMHYIITMIFLGLGIGELLFGILSDAYGRKKIVIIGSIVFSISSLLLIVTSSFELLLIIRVFQGLGLSSARAIIIAIIRDKYEGPQMARIMSFIATVFLVIPMAAPILGQAIMNIFNWKAIVLFQLAFMIVNIVWFGIRIEETLPLDKRFKVTKQTIFGGVKGFFRSRSAVVFTLITGLFEGVFISYLGSSSLIFQDQYAMADEFPYIFGGLAMSTGVFTIANGVLVNKIGMRSLVLGSIITIGLFSMVYIYNFRDFNPGLIITLLMYLIIPLGATAIIFGNTSALAMEEINEQAGIGAALFSFLSMNLGVIVALIIGLFMSSTAAPLFFGFFAASLLSVIILKLCLL